MDAFLFELLILGLILLAIYYFSNEAQQLANKQNEWKIMKAQADAMASAMATQMEYLREEKEKLAYQKTSSSDALLVALQAIITGASLAKEAHTEFSVEYLKKKFYQEYDPERMRCLFLSASSCENEPMQCRKAIFVIIYGQREINHHKAGNTFYQIHTEDGQLQFVKEFDSTGNCAEQENLLKNISDMLLRTTEK